MPQREQCHTVEPMILEHVPFGEGHIDLFDAKYHYKRKLFWGYTYIGDEVKCVEVTLQPPRAALVCSAWIHGWITDDQRTWLYKTASDCPRDEVIVEIGAWKGKSTVILAWGSKSGNRAHVISIDPHEATPAYWIERGGTPVCTWEQYKANIEASGVADVVVPYRTTSLKALEHLNNQPVYLLFIDGDHDYAAQDADAWQRTVVKGGYIALHDSKRREVQCAVTLLKKTKKFEEVRTLDNMIVLERTW